MPLLIISLTPTSNMVNGRIDGGAAHGGGSCQVSLSFDGGVSYTVIKSFIGDCPHAGGGGAFQFTIPQSTPAGTAIFAW